MKMALPAGYSSSEEDDFDEFDDDYRHRKRDNVVPDVKEQRETHLFYAVLNGNVEDVESILNEGIDVNMILRDNYTPLMLAASIGSQHVTRLLIKRGANVNYDKDKFTILMAACSVPETCAAASDILNVVQQLVDHGANINAITRKRMTALMYAASNGNIDVVKLLLPLSDKFAVDNQGWTALFWAVNDNHCDVAELLLKEGFDDSKPDVRGNKPFNYATANGFENIINILPSKPNQPSSEYYATISTFEELFNNLEANKRPQFFDQIYSILYGTKSEFVTQRFSQKNVDLRTFLALTDEQLEKLGVTLPFQRYRILAGLYKFHKHPYKPLSVPVVPRNEMYSNIDVSKSVVSAIRQLIAMEASIDFIMNHTQNLKLLNEKEELEALIVKVDEKVQRIKKITKALRKLAKHWESVYPVPDLITKNSRRPRFSPFKVLFLTGAITLSVLLSWKLFAK